MRYPPVSHTDSLTFQLPESRDGYEMVRIDSGRSVMNGAKLSIAAPALIGVPTNEGPERAIGNQRPRQAARKVSHS